MDSSTSPYRIIDEPLPSNLANKACEPLYPLLALMLVGGWIAWPWFIFNAIALRSASLKQELAIVAVAIVSCILIQFGLVYLIQDMGLSERWARYVFLAYPAVRLTAGYMLYLHQTTTWTIYELFGGEGIGGFPILMVGFFLQRRVEPLFEGSFIMMALQ